MPQASNTAAATSRASTAGASINQTGAVRLTELDVVISPLTPLPYTSQMSAETAISYGMKPVARFRIADDAFQIEITDPALAQEERCIYAFVIGNEIVRVGSSKAKLATRLRSWQRDVTAAFQGRKSPTPLHEADGWKAALEADEGVIFARPGTIVTTPVGEISTYLDEECVLIARHRPRFCRR